MNETIVTTTEKVFDDNVRWRVADDNESTRCETKQL